MDPISEIARRIVGLERSVTAGHRTAQLPHTSVTLADGTDVGIDESVEQARDAQELGTVQAGVVDRVSDLVDGNAVDATHQPDGHDVTQVGTDAGVEAGFVAWELAQQAKDEAAGAARVPARVTGLALAGNVGQWGVTAEAAIALEWDPVGADVDGDPLPGVAYEVFDGDAIAATVSDAHASVVAAAGTSHTYRVRARSAAGVVGDVSEPVTVTAATPAASTLTPSAPTMKTGFGVVVVSWDGTYTVPGSAGAFAVRVEVADGSTWRPQGAALQGAGSVTVPGKAGADVTARLVAVDKLGRPTGTSAPASITVVALSGDDLDAESIWANEAWLNLLRAGVIEADMLKPNVGQTLNLSANEAIVLIAGRQDSQDTAIAEAKEQADTAAADASNAGLTASAAQAHAEAAEGAALVAQNRADQANERLTDHQAVFKVTPTGAVVSTPDGSQELRLNPGYAALAQNGVEVSRWEAGRLIVNEAVVNRARVGAHLFEKHSAGRTIVRPI
ncbi:hypothetical protein [Leucobacter luti]|uniref:hypothetical protein n=1 Tax=Leucobacter luti TaxID=340320 RepID=UPI003CFE3B19